MAEAMTAPPMGVVVAHTPQLNATSAINANANAIRVRSAVSIQPSRRNVMIANPHSVNAVLDPCHWAARPGGNRLLAWSFAVSEGTVLG
jgi:hypothetical protein